MRASARVSATSANLGPGFDCLGLALDLYNKVTLEVVPRPAQPTVVIRGEGRGRLPRSGRNLALRAAQRVLRTATRALFVSNVTLDNAIPVSGGLGSSAAAIVGAMVAANRLLGDPCTTLDLLRMALEFEPHPDNLAPAFFGGLTVSVVDAAGTPFVVSLAPPPELCAVVLTPDRSISTHQSRATLPSTVPYADAVFNVGRAALLVAAVVRGEFSALRTAMEDRLHQPYRAGSYPAMPGIISAALEAGALGAALSGSGPSIIAFCTGPTEPIARAMAAAAHRAELTAVSRELHPVTEGAIVTTAP